MSESRNRKHILLGQLASNGDCLYATAVARQIKVDYPGCHLTWAISSRCRSTIEGNPDVDAVWEIAALPGIAIIDEWNEFVVEAKRRKERGDFDEIFLTQIVPATYHLWAGSVRSSILRAYPHAITVDVTPVLRLSAEEVERVKEFAEIHRLEEKSAVILFECAPRSQQSFVNPTFALEVAQEIIKEHPDVAFVLSSNQSFVSPHENIVDGSVLSLRENAELTKYCSLFMGCSSGVTWVSTSDWSKPLPMVQLVRPDLARSNSAFYDFQSRGADTSNIIEMHSYSAADVMRCMNEVLTRGFEAARPKFHQTTPLQFEQYRDVQLYLIVKFQWKQSFQLFLLHIKEYGFRPQFALIPAMLFFRCLFVVPRRVISVLRRMARK